MVYIGIDPGTANLGLALRRDSKEWVSRHRPVKGLAVALQVILDFLEAGGNALTTVAVEDYAFFGPRKNYGPMKELIGGIRGLCLARKARFLLFQPREKERAKLARPKGQSDHAYDARCLAWLAWQETLSEKK